MKVVVTTAARRRLKILLQFYLYAHGEAYASRVLNAVQEAIHWLGEHPGAGAPEAWIDSGRTHRRWVVGHIKLVYLVKGKILRITDIFDSRQDPRKMIG